MTKVNEVLSNSASKHHRTASHMLSCCSSKGFKPLVSKHKKTKLSIKKEWDVITCSVCLEYPHNAVLLLCSSHEKGCRPYMCATGQRYSNCLEQYKKAYMKLKEVESIRQTNVLGNHEDSNLNLGSLGEKVQVPELLCPLCRGQVKGCTVVEMARKYFNGKKRMCMQDKCTFSGNYKELRRHVNVEHPRARPRAVDPAHEEKWKRLEQQRERNDVISTVISSTPGAVVLGDYVIERNPIFVDYEWEGYSSDDLSALENLGRQYVTSALIYGDGYDSIEENLNLNRSRSTRVPMTSSRACQRYLNNRLRRRRRSRRH
ncbi:hypothetical protein SAY87_023607 [Trapa incisa]|uniref:Uncharacterized protein n=1 Tax=Trapa incisa TaxID=236973 RepID=A0AAN7KYW3_9MYRT|nr:hypothetical protein SAY87_023607 [Trapa incisa]